MFLGHKFRLYDIDVKFIKTFWEKNMTENLFQVYLNRAEIITLISHAYVSVVRIFSVYIKCDILLSKRTCFYLHHIFKLVQLCMCI
jgi:hypothetical protein